MPSVKDSKDSMPTEDSTYHRSENILSDTIPDDIDGSTFDQILEMDDDYERDFSRAIVFGFFDQAEETFKQMEDSVEAKDLAELSSLGHFLKGSSATLGLKKVQDSCEKIQHFGAGKDESGTKALNDDGLCLKKIKETLVTMKRDYKHVSTHLKVFYDEDSS